jgi:AcrR family transcriptional regulator
MAKDTKQSTGAQSRGVKRRLQIIEVAARLFDERGYHDTSMETLAEAVGVRKASLYYYFASKDQLLAEIHHVMIDTVLIALRERRELDLDYTSQLRQLMIDIVELMENQPGYLRIAFEHFRELPADVRTEIARKRQLYRDYVVEVLQRGRSAGEFEFENPDLVALSILGMCNWAYQWFQPNGSLSAADIATAFHQQLMRGLGPANPR